MDRYNESKKKKEEEKEKSSSSSYGTAERYNLNKYYSNFDISGVNNEYINSFITDSNNFFKGVEDTYKGIGWGNASSVYDSTNNTINELRARGDTINAWLYKNKDRLKPEDYDSLSKTINDVYSGYDSVIGGFDNAKQFYGQFNTEDDYNSWQYKEDFYKAYIEDSEKAKNDFKYEDAWLKEADRRKEQHTVLNASDFNEYSQQGANIENPTYDEVEKAFAPTFDYYNFKDREWQEWRPFGEDVKNIATFVRDSEAEYEKKYGEGTGGILFSSDPEFYKYRFLEEDEINIYSYYLAKEGKDRADQYLDSLDDVLAQREGGFYARAFKESDDAGLLSYAFMSAVVGLDQWASGVKNLDNFILGEEADTTSAWQYAGAEIRETIDSDFWKGAYDLGVTTANMLPSILVGSVTGVGGLATMGASVLGNSYAEMRNLGYGEWESRGYAALVTAAEVGLTYVMGGFNKLGGSKSLSSTITKNLTSVDNAIARVALKLGANMVSEGLEEATQSVLEPIFKSIFSGEFEGVDWGEVAYSGLLGALSAGVLEGGKTIAGDVITTNTGKEVIKAGGVNRLTDLATDKSIFSADSVATKIAGMVKENMGAYKIGKLYQEVGATLSEQNKADIIAGLEKEGFPKKQAKKLAEQYQAFLNNEMKLTDEQVKVMEELDPLTKVIREKLIEQNLTSYQMIELRRQSVIGRESDVYKRTRAYADVLDLANEVSGVTSNMEAPLSQAEYQRRAAEAMEGFNADNSTHRSRLESGQAKRFPMGESSSTTQTTPTQDYTVSVEGKTVRNSDGEEINIKGIASNNNGKLKLALDNGEEIDAKDVSFKSKEEALLYEMVADLGVSVDTAKSMIDIYGKGGTSIESYRADAGLAYRYGLMNYTKGLSKLDLTEDQKTRLFGLGRTDAGHNTKARVEANKDKTVKSKAKKNGITYEGFDITKEKLNPVQKASVKTAEFISQVSNLDVHVYKSFKENGQIYYIENGKKKVAPNGWFNEGNQIYLDLNAGNMQQGVMLFTMSHEVGHYIREWNAEQFKALGDFIFEHYDNTDNVDKEINRQIEKRKARYEADNKPIPDKMKLFDEAYEEVVCNALSKMFADPNSYTILAELKKQNQTLWQKLGEAIKKFLEKVENLLKVYSKQNLDNPAGRWVDSFDRKTFKQLQEMYVKAFVEADKNFESAKVNTTETISSNDKKFSNRDDFDWNSEGGQRIATAMDMATCKQMIERAYRIVNPNQYEEKPIYSNAEQWLEDVGADEVALYIENEYILQEKYLDKIPAYIDGDVYVSEIIEAYQAGVLKGTNNKEKAIRLDVSKGVDYKDGRFYSPQKIEGVKALYETANQKITNANRQKVNEARAKILLFAHNRGAVEELGITQSELNKKLRTWSNYSAKARDISQRINNGVALSNAWTGIENSSYLYNSTVSEEDFSALVGDISGSSSEYERRFIASTMLALDTHIDYTGIKFIFGETNFNKGSVLGDYNDSNRTIRVRRGSGLNTVAHEIGHAIDHQWWRDVYSWSGRGNSQGYTNSLSEGIINLDLITDPEVKQWIKNFQVFVDNISDSSSIYNEYTQSKNEVFARFTAQFVEWTMQLATGRNQSFGYSHYSDKFTGLQFIEFAKILQEKAKLDSKYQKAKQEDKKFSDRDYLDAVENGDMKTARRLLYEVAESYGYTDLVYHGTQRFGFTKFDRHKSDDNISFFVTSSVDMAETYSGAYDVKKISENKNAPKKVDSNTSETVLLQLAKELYYSEVHRLSNNEIHEEFGKDAIDRTYINTCICAEDVIAFIEEEHADLGSEHNEYAPKGSPVGDTLILSKIAKAIVSLKDSYKNSSSIQNWINIAKQASELKITNLLPMSFEGERAVADFLAYLRKINDYYQNGAYGSDVDSFGYRSFMSRETLTSRINDSIDVKYGRGNYQLFAKPTNQLVIEGYGANWNRIPITKTMAEGISDYWYEAGRYTATTREVARWAKQQGYDSVKFENILDNGGRGQGGGVSTSADVFAYFDNKLLKSADTVTYDNEGNVIPLSQRFNSNNEDIRYSERDVNPNEFNPEGKTLKEQLQEAFNSAESKDRRYVYVGRFTKEFKNKLKPYIEIKNNPIVMNYRDAYLAMEAKVNGKYQGEGINYHNLGVDGLESALQSFETPEYIILSNKNNSESNHSTKKKIELILQGRDYKNRQLYAIVEVNTKTQNNREFTDVHVVNSVYGKSGIKNRIDTAIKENRVIYKKIEESTQGISQVQYERDINANSSDSSIEEKQDYVNNFSENSDKKNSDRDLDLLEQKEKVIEVLAKETDKLKEDNQYLKELVKLQRKVTHGTMFTKSSVEITAGKLLKNADARGEKSELVSLLYDFYGYIAKAESLAWDDISDKAQPVIDWLKKHKVNRPAKLDAGAVALLKELRSKRIYLDKDQQSEAAYVFGSFYEFRKKAMGSVTVVNKNNPKGAKALESVWMELSERYPAYFDPETISASMPARLLEIIEKLRNFHDDSTIYDYSEEMVNQDLLTQVYDSYWDVSTLHTVADSMQKEINLLKIKHRKKMTEVREYHNEKHNQLKKEHREEIARIKQAYREKNAQTTRELLNRWQESRERATENRKRTEMRHKIKKVVLDLNHLLLHGTKERNIKLGLQEAVADALMAINMDTVSAESRIAKLQEDLLKAKTPEKIAEIQHKIDYIRNQGDNLADKLEAMRKAYSEIKNSNKDEIPSQFKEDASLIHDRIESVIKEVDNTPLRDMSLDQLNAVYDMYKMVLTTIRNANGIWREGKLEDLQQNTSAVMQEIDSLKKAKNEEAKIISSVKEFSWNEMTPYYAFDRIGSPTFTKTYWDFVKGQNTYANDINEAKEFASTARKKYDFNKWNLNQVFEYKCKDGRTFKTTLKHMLSIYAYSKRDQAQLHMEIGGFFHNDKSTFRKGKFGLELVRKDDVGYKVDPVMLEQIKKDLSDSQIKYVDEMQEYLTKMGEKGNEVTRIMWGIDIFKEKSYFPLKSKKDFINKSTETAQAVSLRNDGMTKETVAGASNPIVLEAFDDVWSAHVDRMSQYHGFVIPIDNLNKILHYGKWVGTDSMSVSTMIAGRFGSGAEEYLSQFIKDINGNAVSQGAKNPLAKAFTNFKKVAVGASLSTVIQQPTAILRAMAIIDPKHFIGKPNIARVSSTWGEIKKYAPLAIIKEVGGFDAGGGKQTVSWLNSDTLRGKDKVLNTIDDISMKGAEVADKLGWSSIWNAVKREVKASNPNLAVNSEAFLEKCGQRFTEVIVMTQVYDSTLSRSGFMRSKSEFMKLLTAFMGEPTLSINMMFNAIIKAKRGGKEAKLQAIRTIASVYASIIAASAASSIIYALRDDDEDESYLEKYMQAFGGEFISDIVLAPVTSLPALKDIVSILQGWDVERSDMAIFKDLYDAVTSLDSENKSVYRKIEDFAGAIGGFFGVPTKNLLRTGRELYNLYRVSFDNISGGNIGDAFIEGVTGKEKTKSEKLYEAMISGDEDRMALYLKDCEDQSEIDSAKRSAIRKQYTDGNIDYNTAIRNLIEYTGLDEYEAYWKMQEWDYELENGTSEDYAKYNDFYTAVQSGKNLKAVIKEYTDNGVDKSTLAAQITKYFKPLYKEMSNYERAGIKGYLLNAYALLGYDRTKKSKDIDKWLED